MDIKQNLKMYFLRKRLRLNLYHRNKTLLDRFRTISYWIILDTLILMYVLTPFLTTRELKIEVAHAEMVKAAAEVSQPDSTVIEMGIREEKSNPSTLEVGIIEEYFPEVTEKATRVFQCESGLDVSKHSGVDVMSDGRTFSVGIAQINLTVSNLDGTDCSKAFIGRNKYAKVIDEKLYKKCIELAKNPRINLQTAKKKYESRGNFQAWKWCDNKTN